MIICTARAGLEKVYIFIYIWRGTLKEYRSTYKVQINICKFKFKYRHRYRYRYGVATISRLLKIKALFHIWVAPSLSRCSVGTFSKKPPFEGRLNQSRFSVGNLKTKRFSVGNIKTKTSFCGWLCNFGIFLWVTLKQKQLSVGNTQSDFLWITIKLTKCLWVTISK